MLSDRDWGTLVDKIRAGACTPLIGAGASAGVLPLAGQLARDLWDEELRAGKADQAGRGTPGSPPAADTNLERARDDRLEGARRAAGRAVPDPTDLAQVTQYLAVTHEDNAWPKIKVASRIRLAGKPDFDRAGEPHAVLAGLPFPIFLTTNYDDFMFEALRTKTKEPRREVCRWNTMIRGTASGFDEGFVPTAATPVVFHLHGHADNHDSMVVTEDDYLDFLVAISKDLAVSPAGPIDRPVLPLRIRSAITSKTLLFVGYSLSDVNFRVILRGLVGSLEPSGRQLSIAVQLPPDSAEDPERLQAYLDQYFKWTLNVRIYWGNAQKFVQELQAHYGK